MTAKPFDLGAAILHFFNCLSRNPRGAIWIGICQLALVGGLTIASFFILWPAISGLFELAIADANGTLDESEAFSRVLGILGPFFGFFALSVPFGIMVSLAVQGAWLRYLTKGEVKPVIPFRFGGDEVRLFGVNIMYLILILAGYAGIILVAVFAGVGGALVGADGGGGAAVLLGILVFIGVFGAILVLSVKLASAPAMTVREGQFRFFESWTATKGVFWQMLVAYLAVWVMMMVVSSVIGIVTQMVLLGAFMPLLEQLNTMDGSEDPQVVFDMFGAALNSTTGRISLIAAFLVSYGSQIVMEAMWHSVGAYNAIRNDDDASAATDPSHLDKGHPLGASPSEG
ncbi:hypothetical protein [Maricaulis parjimensis]|uniref:hypothetical protein n=1 Tax=Maricaulis parjimensis TaxID=144023 RepID=UPI0019392A22|nr:hypothetical protein [Maricaulis parjimensis]